jgi:hypothetical protein
MTINDLLMFLTMRSTRQPEVVGACSCPTTDGCPCLIPDDPRNPDDYPADLDDGPIDLT